MIRSNSKKAISHIRSYILNHTDFSSYDIETPTTFTELATILMHIFHEEKIRHERRIINYQESFIDWLSGLPSAFDSCYYYNRSAVADVSEILEETEAEAEKYTEAEAERLLSCLIWRELYKACNYHIK